MDAHRRRSNAWAFIVVGVLLIAAIAAAAVIGVRRVAQQREAKEAEQRELEKRITPTSTGDATADLVDSDYLVTLKWPGAGFKLMGETDARRLGSDAIAVAMHEAGCTISIVPEQIPGGTPEGLARRVFNGAAGQKKTEELSEKASFHGLPAHHLKFSGDVGGIVYNYDNLVVQRGDWFFQLLRAETTMTRGRCDVPLETFVTFQAGTIKGRAALVLPTEATRPIYREKNGLYESAAFGLRVQAPAGAQLVVGEAAAELDDAAALVVLDKSDTVVLMTQALCGDPGPAYLAAQNAATAAQLALTLPAKPTHTVEVGTQTVALYEMDGPAPYTTMLGSALFGDRLLTMRATYSKTKDTTGIELVQRTAAGLTMLDEASSDALARELPGRDSTRLVRVGRSLRGGRYVDYTHGLRAEVSDEPMQANLDVDPAALAAKAVLSLARPRFSVDTLIAVSAARGDIGADHRALAASMLGVTEADLTVDPGGGPKNSKIGYDTRSGVKGRVDISTISRGATNVHVATWGTRSCVERAAPSTAKLLSNVKLESGPIAEAELTPRKVQSMRFGFELSMPDGEWKQTEMAIPPVAAAVMTSYELRGGGDFIAVMAIRPPQTPAPELIVGMLEQRFASKISKSDKLERSDQRVAGVMGRRLKWSDKLSAIIVAAGGTYFVVMVEKAALSTLDTDKVFASFAITP